MTQKWYRKIPSPVKRLWRLLHTPERPTYLVGGAVRDLLRDVSPHDYDLASARLPHEVVQWAWHHGWRSIPSGLRFGTVSLYDPSEPAMKIEHTTFRREGRYTDLRHPEDIMWTSRIEDDLARRDFTINAMAMTWEGRVVDPHGGCHDLDQGTISCVGDPCQRLREDPLRMWRAARFVGMDRAGKPFQLDPTLPPLLAKLWPLLERISPERQRDELWRLLQSTHFYEALRVCDNYGLFMAWWPEWSLTHGFNQRSRHHLYLLNQHLLHTAKEGPTPLLRLAGLLHDIGKPWSYTLDSQGQGHFYGHADLGASWARAMLERLHFDRERTQTVTSLIAHHMYPWERVQAKTLRRIRREWGGEHVSQLWTLRRMDVIGAGMSSSWEHEEDVKRHWQEALASPDVFQSLAINGHDIMDWLNVRPSPVVGWWLQHAQAWVDENPDLNNRERLKEKILQTAACAPDTRKGPTSHSSAD